ncbi:glutamine-dependent NAD(+) synthetase [Irineochytrium annulatum]|nr:glutamine-dependent NAD(+) synthetase [Irineochytrium annulatum]
MDVITVATCSLNQWAMDFEGNKARILESVARAKEMGAVYRLGPELEICGYGCNDHFLEGDTITHSWEVLADLLESPICQDILVDVGMWRLLLIRPKLWMANDGNYREMRWFTPWMKYKKVEDFSLPAIIRAIVGQGPQFSLNDVEVICATVDLSSVRAFRAVTSRNLQAAPIPSYPKVFTEGLVQKVTKPLGRLSVKVDAFYHSPEDEIRLGPACWLWDYLRRSKQNGFFLPLSGGIDSCATAVIVYSMCNLVCSSVQGGNKDVLEDVRAVVGEREYVPNDARELCSYHSNINIDSVTGAILSVFQLTTRKEPKFKTQGGSAAENLALQNIQARSRMVLAYLFAQLLLWVRGRSGSLLVLGSANVDETLRGYFTKYDCSSADLNPIGGISKTDLKKFIAKAKTTFDLPILQEFIDATPTAELEPITSNYVQSDEVDMGMTYEDLSTFGTLRKVEKCGPVSMYQKLVNDWSPAISPAQVAEKVKKFFFYYAINRHKTTVLPPSYHMSPYSPDDNRFDHRPILYNARWSWQFQRIDNMVSAMEL